MSSQEFSAFPRRVVGGQHQPPRTPPPNGGKKAAVVLDAAAGIGQGPFVGFPITNRDDGPAPPPPTTPERRSSASAFTPPPPPGRRYDTWSSSSSSAGGGNSANPPPPPPPPPHSSGWSASSSPLPPSPSTDQYPGGGQYYQAPPMGQQYPGQQYYYQPPPPMGQQYYYQPPPPMGHQDYDFVGQGYNPFSGTHYTLLAETTFWLAMDNRTGELRYGRAEFRAPGYENANYTQLPEGLRKAEKPMPREDTSDSDWRIDELEDDEQPPKADGVKMASDIPQHTSSYWSHWAGVREAKKKLYEEGKCSWWDFREWDEARVQARRQFRRDQRMAGIKPEKVDRFDVDNWALTDDDQEAENGRGVSVTESEEGEGAKWASV